MSVLGVMNAVAKLELKVNLVGCLAMSENSVDAFSQRPHDIIEVN